MKLAAQWNEIIGNGLRELGTRLAPRLQSGATPGSMKEIYDLWVESAESVYAKAAHGAAFMQAQAELSQPPMNAALELDAATPAGTLGRNFPRPVVEPHHQPLPIAPLFDNAFQSGRLPGT